MTDIPQPWYPTLQLCDEAQVWDVVIDDERADCLKYTFVELFESLLFFFLLGTLFAISKVPVYKVY